MTTDHKNKDRAPAETKSSGRKQHTEKSSPRKKADFAKTNRILIILAAVFAVGLCVAIGLKIAEDTGAEQNAQTLLEAYKEQEIAAAAEATALENSTAAVIPELEEQKTPIPTETPEPTPTPTLVPDTMVIPDGGTAEATASPSAESVALSNQLALEGENNRATGARNDDEENVDETAEYIAPENPEIENEAELIQEVLNAVGDDGLIGTIRIPKTEQEYPIIGKWSYKLLKLSICRYSGPNVNGSGNLILIGHNYKSGAHFGNLKTLSVGDEVYLTARGNDIAVRYEIYNILDIDDDNFAALTQYRGDSGLTLMTCTSGGHQRKLFRCVRKAATADADTITNMRGSSFTM